MALTPSSSQKYSLCFLNHTLIDNADCIQRNWKTITIPLHMRHCQSLLHKFRLFQKTVNIYNIWIVNVMVTELFKGRPLQTEISFLNQPCLSASGENINGIRDEECTPCSVDAALTCIAPSPHLDPYEQGVDAWTNFSL